MVLSSTNPDPMVSTARQQDYRQRLLTSCWQETRARKKWHSPRVPLIPPSPLLCIPLLWNGPHPTSHCEVIETVFTVLLISRRGCWGFFSKLATQSYGSLVMYTVPIPYALTVTPRAQVSPSWTGVPKGTNLLVGFNVSLWFFPLCQRVCSKVFYAWDSYICARDYPVS